MPNSNVMGEMVKHVQFRQLVNRFAPFLPLSKMWHKLYEHELNPQCLMNNTQNTIEKIFWKKRQKLTRSRSTVTNVPGWYVASHVFWLLNIMLNALFFWSPSAEPRVPAYWIEELLSCGRGRLNHSVKEVFMQAICVSSGYCNRTAPTHCHTAL